MTIQPIFTQGPNKETYYLGRVKRQVEEAAHASTKRRIPPYKVTAMYRRIIPVFVTYDIERKFEVDFNYSFPWRFFRNGKLVFPKPTIIEGFSFEGSPDIDGKSERYRYQEIEKRTHPDGRVERLQYQIEAEGNWVSVNLSDWDKDILDLLKPLPAHVLDVIGLKPR